MSYFLWLSEIAHSCTVKGIAFGEAVSSFQTPPNQSQMNGSVGWRRLNESGFGGLFSGGWADEEGGFRLGWARMHQRTEKCTGYEWR